MAENTTLVLFSNFDAALFDFIVIFCLSFLDSIVRVCTGDSHAVGDHLCVFPLLGTKVDSERSQATSARYSVLRQSVLHDGTCMYIGQTATVSGP